MDGGGSVRACHVQFNIVGRQGFFFLLFLGFITAQCGLYTGRFYRRFIQHSRIQAILFVYTQGAGGDGLAGPFQD